MSSHIPVRSEIEKLNVYAPGKPIEEVKREFGLERIIKLASNENPMGYSPLAKEAMIRELQRVTLYPEATSPVLVSRLAERLGVHTSEVLVGNGSDELIRLVTRSYIQSGDEAIMADVTFPRYETNVVIDGGNVVKVPLVKGVHDLDAMLEAVTSKTRMIFVCNPNNPTGTIVNREALSRFIESVPSHILMIVDEAYFEYVTDPDYLNAISLVHEHPNLLVLRTFSKIYGLAALRVGYAVGHEAVIGSLMKVKDAFSVNRLAQQGALAALDDDSFVSLCKRKNREGLKYLCRSLSDMGLEWFPSQANFLMIKLPRSGDDVFHQLLKQGIIVRSGRQLDAYEDTIRVTVGTEEENHLFILALQKCLGGVMA